MTDSKVVCLSSDSEADDDTVRNEFTRGKKRSSSNCSFHCTACGTEMFGIAEVHEHPRLHGVGICSDCFDFLTSGPFTTDLDGADDQCTWCGEGGTIVICDNCKKAFCENCIVRNYGRKRGLAPILSNENWSCFCCDPQPLWVHVNRLNEFRDSASSGRDFYPRPKDARTSKTRDAGQNAIDVKRENASDVEQGNASDGKRGNQCQTLGELWTRNKKQNQGKGIPKGPRSLNQCQTLTELLTQNKEQHQGKGIQTSPLQNMKSRRKPSTHQKSVATPCSEQRYPPEAKLRKGIENPQQQAPIVPSARTFIRPHQMLEKRREATERRTRMVAERLKSGVTKVKPNAPQQHDSNLQAKPEIQDGGGEHLRHGRDDESKVKKQNCALM